ncbi:hypothetical protein F5Y18DRAFT_433167 [Xylariaceae sp. FL1019]|nr:hypothetical protein F5Y18DRAFT_433167 [Xylariaceae sp. FL1019]
MFAVETSPRLVYGQVMQPETRTTPTRRKACRRVKREHATHEQPVLPVSEPAADPPRHLKRERSDENDSQSYNKENAKPDDKNKFATVILRSEQIERKLRTYHRVLRDLEVNIVRSDGDDIEYYCARTNEMNQQIQDLCCRIASLERERESLRYNGAELIRRIEHIQSQNRSFETNQNSLVLQRQQDREDMICIQAKYIKSLEASENLRQLLIDKDAQIAALNRADLEYWVNREEAQDIITTDLTDGKRDSGHEE